MAEVSTATYTALYDVRASWVMARRSTNASKERPKA